MIRWRPNRLTELSNNFASSTVDQLPIKWPSDGLRIDNSSWFSADEILLMPTTNVTISSSHFNSYSDGIAAIQHYLKNNFGKTYTISSSGAVTNCGLVNVPGQPAATIISSSLYTASGILLATQVVTASVALTMGTTGSPYTYTVTGNIPSVFGASPWSANNFSVFANSQVTSSSGTVGFWCGENYSNSKFDRIRDFNSIPQIYTMVTPLSGDPDAYKLWIRVLTYQASSYTYGDSNWAAVYPWVFSKNLLNTEINTDSESSFNVVTAEGNGVTPFQIYYSSTYIATSLYGLDPVSGSTSFLRVNCTMTSPTSSLQRSPFLGGFIYHKQQAQQKFKDVGLQFMWHGWLDTPWPYYGQGYQDKLLYALKSGVFLRLKKHATAKTITGAKQYPQYQGYLLRFTGAPSGVWTDNTGTWDYRENVQTWAILKIRYEDFTHTQVSSSAVYNISPVSPFDNYYHDEAGTNGAGYKYSNTLPGEYQILVTGTTIVPVIDRGPSGAALDSFPLGRVTNNRYEYKFEMDGNTIALYQRVNSNSAWTQLGSALDSSPIEPDADNEYWPTGFFSMPAQNDLPVGQLHTYGPLALLFSNVYSYVIRDDSSNSLSCRIIFAKTSGQDNLPSLS